MIENTLFTTLSPNEEANLSGGGGKKVIIVGEAGNTKYGNTNTAIGGDAYYFDFSGKKSKKHH